MFLPAYILGATPDEGQAWLLALVAVVWSGARLAGVVASNEPRLFAFAFWLFSYVFVSLPALVQARSNMHPATTPAVPSDYNGRALAILLVGLLCFEVGHLTLGQRLQLSSRQGSATSVLRAQIAGFVALAAAMFYVSRLGVSALFRSRDAVVGARDAGFDDPTLAAVIYGVAVAGLLVASHSLLSRPRRRSPRSAAPLGAFFLIALLVFTNPIGTSRYIAGTVVGSVVVLAGGFDCGRARKAMVALLVAALFIFPAADAFRRDVRQFETRGFVGEMMNGPDFDSYPQVVNAAWYTDNFGIHWGRQAAGVVLFWVPRSVWDAKPIDTGAHLAQARGYQYTNLSAPLWAEAFVNGGWWGVIVIFFLLGALVRRWDATRAQIPSGGPAAVAAAVLPFYGLILLRGSLLQAMAFLSVFICCLIFVRSPESGPSGT